MRAVMLMAWGLLWYGVRPARHTADAVRRWLACRTVYGLRPAHMLRALRAGRS